MAATKTKQKLIEDRNAWASTQHSKYSSTNGRRSQHSKLLKVKNISFGGIKSDLNVNLKTAQINEEDFGFKLSFNADGTTSENKNNTKKMLMSQKGQ